MPIADKLEFYIDRKQERLVVISTFANGEYITTFYNKDAQLKEQGEPKNARIVMSIRDYVKMGEIIPPAIGG